MRRYLLLASIFVVCLILDQVTKLWLLLSITRPPLSSTGCESMLARFFSCAHPIGVRTIELINDMVLFVYVENPGASWGLFHGSSAWRTPFLLLMNLVAAAFIIYYYRRTPKENWLLRSALAMVLGGAAGNFADRIRFGYVIDFIHVDLGFWPANPWPIWNVADAFISVGVVFILIDGLFLHREPSGKAAKKAAT